MAPPKGHKPYPGCETGGRPKKYTPAFVDALSDKLEKWLQEKDNMFIERFCLENDIPEDVIAELKWNDKFTRAYNRLKTKQKLLLFEGGLKRKFAYPMCALILSTNHNILAKTEQKLTGEMTDSLAFIFQEIDGKTKNLVNDDST